MAVTLTNVNSRTRRATSGEDTDEATNGTHGIAGGGAMVRVSLSKGWDGSRQMCEDAGSLLISNLSPGMSWHFELSLLLRI